jgi:hypothetical protein
VAGDLPAVDPRHRNIPRALARSTQETSVKITRLFAAAAAATAFAAVSAPEPAAAVDICWELVEPLWVPPTPPSPEECGLAVLAGLPHCCAPTGQYHPECIALGIFQDGYWTDFTCGSVDPSTALDQFLRGLLSVVDDSVPGLLSAAFLHIDTLRAGAPALPAWMQTLLVDLRNAPYMAGVPSYTAEHVANVRVIPRRTATADLYLRSDLGVVAAAVTLDKLVILRDDLYDALMRHPAVTLQNVRCGATTPLFREALTVLAHELVHVRQFQILGRDAFVNSYFLDVLVNGYGNDALESEAFDVSDVLETPIISQAGVLAFAHSDNAGASHNPANAFSTGGGTVRINRSGTGNYSVVFPGVARAGGNVLVTALGNDTHTCRVVGWSASGADEVVAVRCHTVAGAAVDARFSVMFHDDERACSGTSFAWADQPAAASYTPSRFYSGNDTMEAQTITRSGPGLYTATLRGLPAGPSGNVVVTAYGSPDTTRCKVQSWSRSGTNATVNVRCHTAAGVAADSRFTIAFDANGVPGRVVGGQNLGAYLWADQAASASYTPSAAYRFNSREIVGLAAAPTITRAARGDYTARLRALPVAGGNAQVTAYGGTTEVCKVVSTAAAGADVNVRVRCFTPAGAAADTRFTLLYTTSTLDF